jgi:hypothetical protein
VAKEIYREKLKLRHKSKSKKRDMIIDDLFLLSMRSFAGKPKKDTDPSLLVNLESHTWMLR